MAVPWEWRDFFFFSVKGNINSAAKAGSLGKMCLTHPLPSLFVILLSYFQLKFILEVEHLFQQNVPGVVSQ